MALPLRPPLLPQLAKSQKTLPKGDGWVYEPKWDGFRAIAFVDGDDVHLQSRNGKPLTRYFPELKFPEGRYVLDGEIVRFDDQGRQDFDALGQRIHPAKSRIDMLAEETPTRFIAFDVLAVVAEDDDLAVEHVAAGREAQLGEVARQRAPVARLQLDVVAVHERDAAEAVPLGLVDPAFAGRQLLGRPGELREERWCERQRHALPVNATGGGCAR